MKKIVFDKNGTAIEKLVLDITEFVPARRRRKTVADESNPNYAEPEWEAFEEGEAENPLYEYTEIERNRKVELTDSAGFSNPSLINASTEERIEWNGNPLPATLDFKPGRYAFIPKADNLDWVLADSDYQARGSVPCLEDTSTEIVLKHWSSIHGESSDAVPDSQPPGDGECDSLGVGVFPSVSWEADKTLVTWTFVTEEGDPFTGFELFINGEKAEYVQAGNSIQVYLPFDSDFWWFAEKGERTARGLLRTENKDVEETWVAKKNAEVGWEDGLARLNIISSATWLSVSDNILEIRIANPDWNVPRSGYSLRLWKLLPGTDGSTPEYAPSQAIVRRKPNLIQEPIIVLLPDVAGDTVSGEEADTWIWEIVNGSWYASGKAVMNKPLTLDVSVASVLGQMRDSRDSKTYKTVLMPDGKLWSAQNLDFALLGTGDYYGESQEDKAKNAALFGRLYSQEEALNYQSSVNFNPSERQGIAPSGWHIPSDDEWSQLMKAVTKEDGYASDRTQFGDKETASHGKYLKSSVYNWKGIDSFGFNALPGGRQNGEEFEGKNAMSEFLSCSEHRGGTAISRLLIGTRDNAERDMFASKAERRGYVRFVKNRVN
jgi:uncharacterized protein (TIGR02145 family)